MQKSSKMLRSTMLTMMVAMGVVISPLLRVEGLFAPWPTLLMWCVLCF